ncbi:MAG: response regulator [Lachnospiraceae bacterium]
MIKVFLVEDEIIIREKLKNNITWEKEGFKLVGESSDGELAYPLIKKTRPDILITDIEMPFMNGLELSRLVKQEMPDIKIIILSVYNEFEYAQEAINIGITEYLLKPITGKKLLEEIKNVAEVIKEEQVLKSYLEKFEKEKLENALFARQNFFYQVVSGRISTSEIISEGRKLGMDFVADQYNILLFQIFTDSGIENYSEEMDTLSEQIKLSTEDMPEVLMFEMPLEEWAFVLKGSEERLILKLTEIVKQYAQFEYFVGVGKTAERLSELHESYKAANRAFAYRYLKNRNQVIYGMRKEDNVISDIGVNLSDLSLSPLDRRAMENLLKTSLKSEIPGLIDEYFYSLGQTSIQSRIFRQYVTVDIYLAALAVVEQLGYQADELIKHCGTLPSTETIFSSVEQTRIYLKQIMETTIDLRDNMVSKKNHTLVKAACSYIAQNYNNVNMSLGTTAAYVNLSSNHFSSVFSQEMGQTFIEYLTNMRMEKAKELLRSTALRSSEIANAVGYRDPHYFSSLFKKMQECTPLEFRTKA